MMRNFYFLLLITLSQFGSIYTEPNTKEIFEIVTPEILKTLAPALPEGETSGQDKITKILSFLNQFYEQFPDDRRTMEEKSRGGNFKDPLSGEVTRNYKDNSGRYPNGMDVNSVRLLKLNKDSKLSSSQSMKNSNTFYRLYSYLGFLYFNSKNYEKSSLFF